MRGMLAAFLFGPCLSLPGGETGAISPPVLGYVFDTKSIHPVMGTPGAAVLGEALAIAPVARAAIAPGQDYALVVSDTGEVGVLDLPLLTFRPVQGATPPGGIWISPAGTAAALYDAGSASIQLLSGLPHAARVDHEFRMDPGTELAALAVSDDARLLLAVIRGRPAAALFSVTGSRELALPATVSAVAFRAGAHDALLADAAGHQVWLIRDVDGRPSFHLLAGPLDGVHTPVAVGFSESGTRALVANRRGTLLSVDLTGGPPAAVETGRDITGLEKFAGGFLLDRNASAGRTIYLVDTAAAQPRVVFIPPEASDSQSRRRAHAN